MSKKKIFLVIFTLIATILSVGILWQYFKTDISTPNKNKIVIPIDNKIENINSGSNSFEKPIFAVNNSEFYIFNPYTRDLNIYNNDGYIKSIDLSLDENTTLSGIGFLDNKLIVNIFNYSSNSIPDSSNQIKIGWFLVQDNKLIELENNINDIGQKPYFNFITSIDNSIIIDQKNTTNTLKLENLNLSIGDDTELSFWEKIIDAHKSTTGDYYYFDIKTKNTRFEYEGEFINKTYSCDDYILVTDISVLCLNITDGKDGSFGINNVIMFEIFKSSEMRLVKENIIDLNHSSNQDLWVLSEHDGEIIIEKYTLDKS